jgi:3-oxoacyl-[acyl-carrier-protein] synthase II
MPNRVVVTGLGPLTPIGIGKTVFWEALSTGKSGVCRVDDRLDLSGIEVKIGAPVVDFDPLDHMDRRRARRLDRAAQFALVATKLALDDANLGVEKIDAEQTGVVAGTGIGGLETMETNYAALTEHGPRRVSPFFIPRLMPNAIAGQIAIERGGDDPLRVGRSRSGRRIGGSPRANRLRWIRPDRRDIQEER